MKKNVSSKKKKNKERKKLGEVKDTPLQAIEIGRGKKNKDKKLNEKAAFK